MPSSKRPPLMTSMVEDILAVRAGLRNPVHTTMWPSRTRLGRHRQGGQDGERLEGDLVGRLGHGVEVVEDPQRLEPEGLGLLRRARSCAPRRRPDRQPSYSPFQPCGAIRPTCIRSSCVRRAASAMVTVRGTVASGGSCDVGWCRPPILPRWTPPPSTRPRHSPARPIRGPRPTRQRTVTGRRST